MVKRRTGPAIHGYAGKPLDRKLGFREGLSIAVLNDPGHFVSLLTPEAQALAWRTDLRGKRDLVVCFADRRRAIERRLPALVRAIEPDGAVWFAWPKKSSGVPTDITEDVLREIVLPQDLVDVKVCAIDATWSGLKVMIRREKRRTRS